MTKIPYYNASSKKINGLQVFLDIDKNQKISNCSVEVEKDLEQSDFLTNTFANIFVGLKLEDATKISMVDIYENWCKQKNKKAGSLVKAIESGNFPFEFIELSLLQESILNYFGVVLPFAEAKDVKASSLICKCFGVYKSEVSSFINDKIRSETENGHLRVLESISLSYLTENLEAGAACGSCHDDLKEIIAQGKQRLLPFPEKPILEIDGSRKKIYGLSPRELAFFVTENYEKWRHEQCSSKGDLHISMVRGPFIQIHKKSNLENTDLINLSSWFEEKFNFYLEFRTE